MKQLLQPILKLFHLICIALAGYMTTKQIIIYFQNEDISAISFQKFSDIPEDMSPTYTFCLHDSARGNIYRDGQEQYFDVDDEVRNCHLGRVFDYKVENNKFIIAPKNSCEILPSLQGVPGSLPPLQRAPESLHPNGLPELLSPLYLVDLKPDGFSCNFKKNRGRIYNTYQNYDYNRYLVLEGRNKTFGISPKHFKEILMGLEQDFYFEQITPELTSECKIIQYSIDDVIGLLFDDNVISLSSFLLDYQMKTLDGIRLGWSNDTYAKFESICVLREIFGDEGCEAEDSFQENLQNRVKTPFPFQKVYQDPTRVCYSPTLYPGRHRKMDQITLDLNILNDEYLSRSGSDGKAPVLSIHVHMQGQFIRSIGKEIESLSAQDLRSYCPKLTGDYGVLCYGTQLYYDISQVTVIRNRPDSNDPCNPSWLNEDSKIIETILNEEGVNCIPIFWISTLNFTINLPQCSTTSQYDRLRAITANYSSFETFRKTIDHPCEEMSIVTNTQRVKGRREQSKPISDPKYNGDIIHYEPDVEKIYLDIQIRHVNDDYQNITNSRGFSAESCWSGIGGFIGIFVGVSLMQIPQILQKAYYHLFGYSNSLFG